MMGERSGAERSGLVGDRQEAVVAREGRGRDGEGRCRAARRASRTRAACKQSAAVLFSACRL